MSTIYSCFNKKQKRHPGQTETTCSGCGRPIWVDNSADTLCKRCKNRLDKYGTLNITSKELKIIWARTAYIKRNGSKVFNCAKCGALSSSKDLNQTLCKNCRPKKTASEIKSYRQAYYMAHREKRKQYMLQYHRLGKTKIVCAECGREFWHINPKEKRCWLCRKKINK